MPSHKLAHSSFLYCEDNVPLYVRADSFHIVVGGLRLHLSLRSFLSVFKLPHSMDREIHSSVAKEYLRSKTAETCWTRFIVTI